MASNRALSSLEPSCSITNTRLFQRPCATGTTGAAGATGVAGVIGVTGVIV